jgi:hypothetical protein
MQGNFMNIGFSGVKVSSKLLSDPGFFRLVIPLLDPSISFRPLWLLKVDDSRLMRNYFPVHTRCIQAVYIDDQMAQIEKKRGDIPS